MRFLWAWGISKAGPRGQLYKGGVLRTEETLQLGHETWRGKGRVLPCSVERVC